MTDLQGQKGERNQKTFDFRLKTIENVSLEWFGLLWFVHVIFVMLFVFILFLWLAIKQLLLGSSTVCGHILRTSSSFN